MQCRMCGFEFDENAIEDRGCCGCGRNCSSTVHCPNCGYGNTLDYEQEFEFVKKLKNKLTSFRL